MNEINVTVTVSKEKTTEGARTPPLNDYTIVMEAASYKEVPIKAVSPETALELVREMYLTTDALDFNDGDVTELKMTVQTEGGDEQ